MKGVLCGNHFPFPFVGRRFVFCSVLGLREIIGGVKDVGLHDFRRAAVRFVLLCIMLRDRFCEWF